MIKCMKDVVELDTVDSELGGELASVSRAREIAEAAQAMQPGSPAQGTLRALVCPAGTGTHLVQVNDWSTSVTVNKDGSIEIENPMVGAGLHRIVNEGQDAGIIVRTFTKETSHTLPDGTKIPVKQVRGWHLSGGAFHGIDERAIFSASCTDAVTGEPIAPERGVRYMDAYPVKV
jgi:hypothetical protein